MPQNKSHVESGRRFSGWIGIGFIGLTYATLFVLNFLIPLKSGTYTSRIWEWSQMALTIAALIVLIVKRRSIKPGNALAGLVLAVTSASSRWLYNSALLGYLGAIWLRFLLECVSVWLCFLAGILLFKDLEPPRVAAFQLPLKRFGSSILFGVAAGIPFAIINNLYFYINSHSVQFQSVFSSAYKAFSAGIGEEIIFRFFVLALCFTLLKSSENPRSTIIAAVTMAVVPHSLNHFPDLFMENTAMGFAVFLANVLLFGLPMAWLQIRKNLETAMAFHWFIDFMRFFFGF